MSTHNSATGNSALANNLTRTIRFHDYGEPAKVLRLEETGIPEPAAGRIRVRVYACGLNPADWALCRGLFAANLPRGIGLEVSGTVDEVGESVVDVSVGDKVFGAADYAGCALAGASDYAIMNHWAKVPPGLDLAEAAALPMATETAFRSLESLKVASGQTLLVNGAGTTVGYAAVIMSLLRGARVIATAGETYASKLRNLGATVTAYGDGLIERVRAITRNSPDLILDAAPPSGALPDLVKIVDGNPRRILTISDFTAAKELGIRDSFEDKELTLRYDVLPEFAKLAAEGRYSVPIARTFTLEEWKKALDLSQSGHPHGKLLLVP